MFQKLGPGGFHSGAQLATQLGVSRNAIWKAVGILKKHGVIIHAVRNRGYRLAVPTAPLNAQAIRDGIDPQDRARLRRVEVAWQLESTNSTLFARSGSAGRPVRCIAGRGANRRPRSPRPHAGWPLRAARCVCQLGWTFGQMPRDVGSLGLAVGVCVLRALRAHLPAAVLARTPLQLKWPNDLQCDARKLGGILIDLRAEAGGPSYVVIGMGLNVALDEAARTQISATGTAALRSAVPGSLAAAAQ